MFFGRTSKPLNQKRVQPGLYWAEGGDNLTEKNLPPRIRLGGLSNGW